MTTVTPSTSKFLPVSPATVLLGPGVRRRLGEVAAEFGPRAVVVTGPHAWPAVEEELSASLSAAGVAFTPFTYDPDCTEPACEQAAVLAAAEGAGLIIGVGGGKALDLAKLVGAAARLPVVNVPTSAATCAVVNATGGSAASAS